MEPKGNTGISAPMSLSITILSVKIILDVVVKEILRFQSKNSKIVFGLLRYSVI